MACQQKSESIISCAPAFEDSGTRPLSALDFNDKIVDLPETIQMLKAGQVMPNK